MIVLKAQNKPANSAENKFGFSAAILELSYHSPRQFKKIKSRFFRCSKECEAFSYSLSRPHQSQ
jgi:hypothetical protein